MGEIEDVFEKIFKETIKIVLPDSAPGSNLTCNAIEIIDDLPDKKASTRHTAFQKWSGQDAQNVLYSDQTSDACVQFAGPHATSHPVSTPVRIQAYELMGRNQATWPFI
ncbi:MULTISPECIES: hypothetical protein [Methylobacterium]|uniref:hypothetical protein n=1 Tax=Methylobacterium TaxID=407 RepID=UPI002F355B48